MKSVKELEKTIFESLKKDFGYTNTMQAPKLVKVVLSAGVGSFKDKKKHEIVADRLAKISGQKAASRGAKKSIASYKTRQGDIVGYQVTLHGPRMYGFLDKFFNAALPRTKDFRGVPDSAVDDMGNLTLGLREHTIFPETGDEELKDVFGFAVTVVTSAKTKKESVAALKVLGAPFRKA
ncbi:MAG: 50S ribosomal protein L5 [Candidatus Taylorbacteria bacterium]|nr:50S ribosomal protein L5 [Candidatus Taylorbacteria bacterium]